MRRWRDVFGQRRLATCAPHGKLAHLLISRCDFASTIHSRYSRLQRSGSNRENFARCLALFRDDKPGERTHCRERRVDWRDVRSSAWGLCQTSWNRRALARAFPQPRKRRCGAPRFARRHESIGLFSTPTCRRPSTKPRSWSNRSPPGELDVAFGSRALDRTLIGQRQPWRRDLGGRVFNLIVRLATGLPFWDTQCGFKAFRLEVFRPILEIARTDGFGFDVELLYLARKANLRMREIPVRWNHCEGSKVSFARDSVRMLREIAAVRSSEGRASARPWLFKLRKIGTCRSTSLRG
jgi:hypothetical protein